MGRHERRRLGDCGEGAAPVPGARLERSELDTITYDIEGRTGSELRASLNQRGPEDESGRHDAYTKWFVRWFYDYERAERQCSLKNVRATIEVKYTLPRWPDENPEVGPRWQAYLAALRAHEKGHMQNGIDAARFIVSAIQAMPLLPDCDAAGAAANAKANEELEIAHAVDRAYDAEAKRGATFR
jgi:predicted secreted Zn-dependent protease